MKKKVNFVWRVVACILSLTLLLGCATIMGKSSPETLNIRSSPDQADVTITDEKGAEIFKGKTPTTVTLQKKKGYFAGKKYNVKICKAGCSDYSVSVDTKLSGWYFGNILFGGLIGILIVDPLTGAMWTLDTNELDVKLTQHSSLMESMQLGIALLNDVPITLRHKMVSISE